MRTLHLTWILLIAVISMRGDALPNDSATGSSNISASGTVVVPPEPIANTTAVPPSSVTDTTTGLPNITTAAPITTTTLNPTPNNVTTTTLAPTDSTNATTVAPATTTAQPVPSNKTTTSPPAASTTVIPKSSTSSAVTTERPDGPTQAPSHDRHFDGLSFMGGIILAVCFVTIGAFSWKLYKVRQDRNYRTL